MSSIAVPRQVADFQRLLDVSLADFLQESLSLGPSVCKMVDMVKQAFQIQLQFIQTGLCMAQPSDASFGQMVAPLSSIIQEIQKYREDNRKDQSVFNHLSTISESIVALSWISVKPAPTQFVRDMKDSGEYFGNRVLTSHKGTENHVNWINKWRVVLKELEEYVKEHHRTGFSWGACGKSGGMNTALPPPPPPPPGPLFTGGGDQSDADNERLALMQDIRKGVDIVKMLKKVDKTAPRREVPVAGSGQHAHQKKAPSAPAVSAPQPVFQLDGKRWRVEHHKNNYSLVISDQDMANSLAMFKNVECGCEIKNKMNAITIDQCKKLTVVLSDIISSVDVIHCQSVKLVCNGKVPIISLDSCDSIQIFVSAPARDVQVISSKSSSCNMCLLESDGDYIELPVPEQIETSIQGKKLVSKIVDKV
ncbi:adenylyl cyclase-associated protein 2-like [Uloborus diversus]|uniref:adenylyl cyclase-associated protein 2-like n=1 Tax=Uloborus diversus TaxID=327109 RepID=UPI00240A0956|nr:adenylyl cyclase-associated protein 2-like [Uloborus diversus]